MSQQYKQKTKQYTGTLNDEKENNDSDTTDDEIYDDYKADNINQQLFASSNKGLQQNKQDKSAESQINELETVNREKDIDEIQRFIGQIAISFKDLSVNSYYYGTGTVYKHLRGKYYIVLTCAHNLLRGKNQPAVKLFYLPEGINKKNDEKKESNETKTQKKAIRLECVEWKYYQKYNPKLLHCKNDIGIILCYDGCKYYKKLNLEENVNDYIAIEFNQNKKKFKKCHIYGYPTATRGILSGTRGSVVIAEDNDGEWEYKNIYTFPGQSGSSLYVWDTNEDKFKIVGIHTFGDIELQINRGVRLTKEHFDWINQTIQQEMEPAIHKHKQCRANRKEERQKTTIFSDLKLFLDSINLNEYYQNFTNFGVDTMNDFKELNID
eukprot:40263_1